MNHIWIMNLFTDNTIQYNTYIDIINCSKFPDLKNSSNIIPYHQTHLSEILGNHEMRNQGIAGDAGAALYRNVCYTWDCHDKIPSQFSGQPSSKPLSSQSTLSTLKPAAVREEHGNSHG